MLQNVQDMEDKILHDSQKTQRLANDLKKRTHDYKQTLTEVNIIFNKLIITSTF
jgi:Holliday junction resolvasome RuvABC ATP-dependent DNA helicase subunit